MNYSETYGRIPGAITQELGGLFGNLPAVSPPEEVDDEIFDLPWEPQPVHAEAPPEPDAEFSDEEILIEDESEAPIKAGSVVLRDYQERCVTSVLREFKDGTKSTLVVSATGTGKGPMIAALGKRAADKDHGVLILVHRDELITQLVKSVGRVGIVALKEKAGDRALGGFGFLSKVVVASVQTMRGKRLEQWPKDAFKLAIIDECHHVVGQSYRDVLNHFGMQEGRLRVAGFTATADRLDKENIGQVFQSLAFEYNIKSATQDGWLVPIEAIQLKTDPPINLKDLRTTAGDLNQGDLEREINQNIGVLVNSLVDTNALEGRRTICFTPNVSSARAMAQALSDVGISAQAVAGADSDRAQKFADHQAGKFQVLCNCAVATEGYDDRRIQAVLICRPTKSRALYSQMVGRGTRLPEEGDPEKKNCRVVDFAFLTGKHQLVSPVDLYDNSETPDEVVEAARKILASGGAQSLDLALESAQMEYEETRRVRIQRRVVSVKASKFDPLTACDIYGIAQKAGAVWENTTPCSEKQALYLQKRAISTEGMTKATASKLISKMESRKEHGWASPWQVRDLIQNGLDPQAAVGMREKEAASYLASNPVMATDGQQKMMRYLGVPAAEIATMTKRDAMARIAALKSPDGA